MYSFLPSYIHFYFICTLGDDEATKVMVTSYPTQPTLSLRRIHFFRALCFLILVTFQPEAWLTLLRFFVFFFSTTKKIATSLKIGNICIFFTRYSFMNSEVAVKVGESHLVSSREYFLWTLPILHLSRQWTISEENNP